MADNSSLPVASGNETFANDDIGGVKYPRPKMNWGPDGTANDVDVASGKPLPVQLRGSDGTDRSNSLPVSVASGGIASGGVASGAVASGAFASGSIASGAMAAGSHAAGSGVDGWDLTQGAIADAAVTAGATGSISAKLRSISRDIVSNIVLAAGSALIGKVDVQFAGTVPDTGAGTGGSKTQRVIVDSSQFSALGQTTKSASTPVTIASDQGYAGNVGGITTLFPVTLSLDTSAYASGDVLADTQVLTSLFRISDGTGVLQSIQVIDQDDQKQAIDFYYLSANNSIGTENSAPNISDANAIEMVGPFSVAAADYKDLGGVSVAKISNIGQPIIAVSGTANGYIAAICNSGTPTYTASGIKLRLGILRD